MKVVLAARSLNEEHNIERFCQAYGTFCDEIVIVDGGSTDRTVELALLSPKVVVSTFDERHYFDINWRNPHGSHINACIQAAKSRGADWIIFDDVDCVPTVALQQNARRVMEETTEHSLFLYRMYLYGTDQWFPEMNKPGKSLWAWKADVAMRALTSNPLRHHMYFQRGLSKRELDYPLSCLHYFAETEELIQRKMKFYSMVNEMEQLHPLQIPSYGPLEPLPDWARWK